MGRTRLWVAALIERIRSLTEKNIGIANVILGFEPLHGKVTGEIFLQQSSELVNQQSRLQNSFIDHHSSYRRTAHCSSLMGGSFVRESLGLEPSLVPIDKFNSLWTTVGDPTRMAMNFDARTV